MTRADKLRRIQTYRGSLYTQLCRFVPNLIADPESASTLDISIYNEIISKEALSENNPSFKSRFSF